MKCPAKEPCGCGVRSTVVWIPTRGALSARVCRIGVAGRGGSAVGRTRRPAIQEANHEHDPTTYDPYTCGDAPPGAVGPGEAVGRCLTKYADFTGRAPRSEYWWFLLTLWLAVFAAAFVGDARLLYRTYTSPDRALTVFVERR